MRRTRLRGVEIGGVRMAVEVPPDFDWARGGLPACSAEQAEVYVGVRIGETRFPDCDSVVYGWSEGTFEVGRAADDWWVAIHGWEGCERVARFSNDFTEGEVWLSPETAAAAWRSPIEHPLDELVVLHRAIRTGGLIARGAAVVRDGRAVLILEPGAAPAVDANWRRLRSQLGTGDRVAVRVDGESVRVHGIRLSGRGERVVETDAPTLAAIHVVQPSETIEIGRLDDESAADELLTAALAPVHAPEIADQLLTSVSRLSERVPVYAVGMPRTGRVTPFAWGQRHAACAFATTW